MSGPIIMFNREIHQYMQENNIRYHGVAALSVGIPEMIALIHEVNTPVAWAALAAVFRAWFNRHKKSRVELSVQENGQTRKITLTGYSPRDVKKLETTELITATFTEKD